MSQRRKRDKRSPQCRKTNKTVSAAFDESTRPISEYEQLRALFSHQSQQVKRRHQRHSRIVQEEIQQCVAAVRWRVLSVLPDCGPQAQTTLQEVCGILSKALESARLLTTEISPPVLYESGLLGGLEWLSEHIRVKHGLAVHLDVDSSAEPVALDMRLLLFDCAQELLLNAARHAGVSQAKLVLERTQNGCVKLTVSDEGKGFDSRLLEQPTPDAIAFGLLGIAERLAQAGGAMEVDTAPGRGARFTLVAPSDTCTVLICDDHAIVRAGYIRLLQTEPGINVVGQAANGRRAIELAEELSPDIVIMDFTLPDMDGCTATRRILEANPRIRVIGLSMHDEDHIIKAMLEAGAVQYMRKSESHEKLIAAIKECRDRRDENLNASSPMPHSV